MFDSNSRIKDLVNNPIGRDIVTTIIEQKQISERLIYNPLVKNIKLKHLQRITKNLVDEKFITMICSKLNQYTGHEIPLSNTKIRPTWWKEAVAYQIYPRSFYDSNDDGIGDIKGIISKLDYLKELGIDLLWLSPIYDSPNDDNGYDIRDYQKIMEEFGTMDDFDALLEAVHKRDMRLIMDLVVNHTSDEHDWYQQALKSKENPYRNYYIWAENGKEKPNNWTSFFSGSAWNYDEKNKEWGLHLFSKKQMDLNWSHKPMREAIYKMINWWLDKGIDGFRLDVINFISKEDGLPDGNKVIGDMMGIMGAEHYFFGPHIHDYLHEMNRETFSEYDCVTVGETPGTGLYMSEYFTHETQKELDMIFNFEHLDPPGKGRFDIYKYDLNALKSVLLKWQTKYNNQCWNSLFFENHDNPRMISKVDNRPEYRERIGKLLAMILLTLKGTPFIYQGQELGMINVNFETIDDYKDVESINLYNEKIEKGEPCESILKILKEGSRDNSRIPMPWNKSNNGGFTKGEPWIKEKENYKTINAKESLLNEYSVYHFYKKLIEFRHKFKTLVYGDFVPVKSKRKNVFCYYRKDLQHGFYIEINLTDGYEKPVLKTEKFKLLLSNYDKSDIKLRPYECALYLVKS